MKKLSLFLLLAAFIKLGFAQIDAQQTASSNLSAGILDKALESINKCVQDPSAAKDAKSWFIRGNIFLAIAESPNENDKNLDPDPLKQAIDSYGKATKYDSKKEISADISEKVSRLRNVVFNRAVDSYNKQSYKEAMLLFEQSANALAIINIPDTVSLNYAAGIAVLAKEKPKAIQYYNSLIKAGAKSLNTYVALSDIYRQENDSTNAIAIIRAGQKIYGNDTKLLLADINIDLTFNNRKKALEKLIVAVEKEPGNSSLYFAMGTIYENKFNNAGSAADSLEAYTLAEKAYKSAIKINPAYFEPNYNLGALYVNSAATIIDKANALPTTAETEYQKMKEEANTFLKNALPYLEKASEINPQDMSTLLSLQQIYTRFKNADKLTAVNQKMANLQKK